MPFFPLGQIVATPAALETLASCGLAPSELIERHARGDWGEVCSADARRNEEALTSGARLMSVYRAGGDAVVWVITDAEDGRGRRQATTLLLPEDY